MRLIVASFVMLFSFAVLAEELQPIEARWAEIKIDGVEGKPSCSFRKGAALPSYGFGVSNTVNYTGSIKFYDRLYIEVASYSVRINADTIGGTGFVSVVPMCNKKMSLKRISGKTVKDLLGLYKGTKVSLGLLIGASGVLLRNENGVWIADSMAHLDSLGAEILNYTTYMVMPYDNLSFDQVRGEWERPIVLE